mgnify:FL=1
MSVRRLLLPLVLLALPLALGACGGDQGGFATPPEPPTPVDPDLLCTNEGATRCMGARFQTCIDGQWSAGIACETPTPYCDAIEGCRGCDSGTAYCVGREIWQCSDDGTVTSFVDECLPTETCLAGQCYDACQSAESQLSYLGCRFLAVPTANLVDAAFDDDFALVVGNPNDSAAEVTLRTGGLPYDVVEVPAESTLAIPLPYQADLKGYASSRRVQDGAYEVRTNVPVVAYQYSPLHFRSPADPAIYSYTNDASMLLPEHVLTSNYIVSTWPSWGISQDPAPVLQYQWVPGLVAITGTTNGTDVTVTFSADTTGGDVTPQTVGSEATYSLDRGDVLQIFSHQPTTKETDPCGAIGGERSVANGAEYCLSVTSGDLTGTVITATEPVAVFAGHACTFMPFFEWACDHLEEMMFPLETWGANVVVSAPTYPGGYDRAPTIYRIIAANDGTLVRFDPAVEPAQFLDRGQILQFETDEHLSIEAGGPISVTQAMLGQQALDADEGDPALGTGIPINQWRAEYDFLAPDTYTWNHVNVVAPAGTQIFLDGLLIEEWEPIGGSTYVAARVLIDPGSHHIESVDDVGFSITSYGYASFTSYLHPGGLNFLR